MIEYNIKIKMPVWLDLILAKPVLLYRLLRHKYTYRLIPLTRGKFAKVDPDNYYRFMKYYWQTSVFGTLYYARRTERCGNKRVTINMHREVLNAPKGLFVDHINGDGLDNRRANLRLATPLQNSHNRQILGKGTSRFKGVSLRKDTKKWHAVIYAANKRISLGYFETEVDAAKAYDKAALKYHKEFARLNFPEEN